MELWVVPLNYFLNQQPRQQAIALTSSTVSQGCSEHLPTTNSASK